MEIAIYGLMAPGESWVHSDVFQNVFTISRALLVWGSHLLHSTPPWPAAGLSVQLGSPRGWSVGLAWVSAGILGTVLLSFRVGIHCCQVLRDRYVWLKMF